MLARHLLRYTWAAPASAAGLAVAAALLVLGASARVVDGTLEVAGGHARRALAWLPAPWRFSAITLGHVIIGIDHRALRRVRAHEHVHVRQYERWGVLLLVLYPASSLLQILRGRDPYRDNCFEREAFAAAHCIERTNARSR